MKHSFAAIILGGTGQVGGAAVAELLATSEYREVVMITTCVASQLKAGCTYADFVTPSPSR